MAEDMREWGKDDDGYEEGDEPEDPAALVGRTLYHVILATTWDEDAQQEAIDTLRDELDQSRGG